MNEYTWLRPGAVGDIILTLNLASKFIDKFRPEKLVYKCHPSIAPVVGQLIIDMGFDDISIGDPEVGDINLRGYPLADGYPRVPMKKHLIEYFAQELHVEPDFDSFILPKPKFPEKGDFITVHPKAGWSPYKNWTLEHWNMVCFRLAQHKIKVIQIGGPGDPKLPNCHGRVMVTKNSPEAEAETMFNTCLAALANAKVHMGVDSWTNHATNIQWHGKGRTRGVILWGSTQVSASGYKTNKNISKNLPCQPCFREDPKISSMPLEMCPNPPEQTYESPKHQCMADITVKEVFESVLELWETT